LTQFVQALILGLMIGGVYALLASGLTLIFGVMDVINVAQGALIILSAFMTWALWKEMGIDPLLGALITTPAMFVIGWVIYRLTIQWISGRPASTSVLLTFALALVLEGIMGLVWSTTYHSSTPGYVDESFRAGGFYFPKAQLFGCAIAIGVLAALYMMLTRTWLGRAIRAVSENVSSARLVGVNARKVAALTFAIGVATTGAGGSIASVLYPFLPGSHYQWIARLLGIIVLGGMGSLPGAAIGALALGVAETMTVTYISPAWATAVPYIFVIIVLLVRPQGLLGSRLREDVATA
jgi:branched-chain amino acid transport system permease protein